MLFEKLIGVLAVSTGAAAVCPGSSAWFFHTACEVRVTVHNKTCGAVHAELISRVVDCHEGKWRDPHNGGEYYFVHANSTYIRANRWTGNASITKYLDLMDFELVQKGIDCEMTGCSESQVTSWFDAGTNYCNMRNLYCNSTDGCVSTSSEGIFNYTEEVFNCGIHDPKLCGTISQEERLAMKQQREEEKTAREKKEREEAVDRAAHFPAGKEQVVVDNNGFSDARENSAWIENIV